MTQEYGKDDEETLTLVACMNSARTLITIAFIWGCENHDICSEFTI